MTELIVMIVIILIASVLQSTAGFGYSIVTMMLFPLYFSVPESIVLKSISGMVVVASICIRYRKHINYKLLLWPLVLSIPGSIYGVFGVTNIDNDVAMKILGISLVLLSIYFFFLSERIRIPANKWTAMIGGGISGLMGGIMGVPGPPIVLYYSVVIKKKEVYLATIQTFLLINDIIRMIFLTREMTFTPELTQMLPIAIGVAIIGLIAGDAVFKRMSSDILHKVIYVMMSLSGIYYIMA